jgi:hypothetical protein
MSEITMAIDATQERPSTSVLLDPERNDAPRGRGWRTVPWLTIAGLAVVMAYADGFWLTSLQGAVGSIERTQGPSVTWLRDSTGMVPVFGLAVLASLALARRWFGSALRRPRTVVAAALLIAAAGTVVGIGEVVASSAYDFSLQSRELQKVQWSHFHSPAPTSAQGSVSCNSTCQAQRATLTVHARALGYVSPMLLGTNVVLVGWVVALRGGQLDGSTTRRRAARART